MTIMISMAPTLNYSQTDTSDDVNLQYSGNILKLLSINVCGINRRLNYPEFIELVNRYDLLCFTETKTDDLDTIELDNNVLFAKNRQVCARIRSGGIVVGCRENLSKCITPIETECKYVYWFRVKGELFDCENDVLFGFVYIPPQCSNYSSSEAFNEIELEYFNLISQFDYACLTGDFNARVPDKKDFFEESDLSNFEVSIDTDCDILTDVNKLNIFNINIDRKSCDKKTIFFWKSAVEFL